MKAENEHRKRLKVEDGFNRSQKIIDGLLLQDFLHAPAREKEKKEDLAGGVKNNRNMMKMQKKRKRNNMNMTKKQKI